MSFEAPKVFLVGAGPGDPGLITRRGLELIRSCDVLLYDRLVDPRLLDEAPDRTERVFVGKTPGSPSRPQAEIDALIVEHAKRGERVVRLKGGDPFVFGRGADEAQALTAAGISFEIVPGVSSVIAVPAYAGIPVTHSGASSSFAVMTAHESAARPEAQQRWTDVARGAGTLVLVMGVAALEETCERLIAAGRDPEEPAAVVERGTTRDQRTVVAPLASLAESARAAGIAAPAITVVGPVVRLRDALSWFESEPLFGRRVIVTRPVSAVDELRAAFEGTGADVVAMPLIEVQSLEQSGELDDALTRLAEGGFEWIAFASRNAVGSVIERLGVLGTGVGDARIAAVGVGTAESLRRAGLAAAVVAEPATGEGLAAALGEPAGSVLVPTSLGRPSRAADALMAAGWGVEAVPAYRTDELEPGPWQRSLIEDGAFDVLVFASGSAVSAFADRLGPPEKTGLGPAEDGPKIVAIGPTTAEDLTAQGFRVDRVAQTPTAGALAEAILELFRTPT